MPQPEAKVYAEMLDPLYAAVTSGPSINCRPHNSRQGIDLALLAQLSNSSPEALLAQILQQQKIKLNIKPAVPKVMADPNPSEQQKEEQRKAEEQ